MTGDARPQLLSLFGHSGRQHGLALVTERRSVGVAGRCSLMEGHSPLSIGQLPDRAAQVVVFLCLRWNAPSASICNQSDTLGKPMDRKVATTKLAFRLRFLITRKAFDHLLAGPDSARRSKLEEFVSEQSRHFVCGCTDFSTVKFLFQLA
jgi:hypothetical protein